MLRLISLSSGSCGNSTFIQTDKTKILVDAGASLHYLGSHLSPLNVKLDEIDALLLTHEHSDHIRSAAALSRRFGVPIFANADTLDALPRQFKSSRVRVFPVAEHFEIGDLQIEAVPLFHDSAAAVGFWMVYKDKKICIATDLGRITPDVERSLSGADVVMLESNHDLEMLAGSRYPRRLKHRIAGDFGHLSNVMAGKTLARLASGGEQKVLLAHLSEESNTPETALSTINEILGSQAIDSIKVSVAGRMTPSPLITV